MRLFPGRINRYLFGELFTPSFLSVSLYTFVLLMNQFFLIAEKALAKGLGWELTLRLFAMYVPKALVMSVPMGVLLGTMIAVGRLSADHEWVALQSTGAGPGRLFGPVAVFGTLAMLLNIAISVVAVPRANYAMRSLRGQVMFASNLASDLKPRVFHTALPNDVLFVEDIQPGTEKRLRGVLLRHTEPGQEMVQLVLARYGDLYPAPDRMDQLVLDLYDGAAHVFDPENPETYRFGEFEFSQERLLLPAYVESFLEAPDKVVRDMGHAELTDEIDRARAERAHVLGEIAAGGGKDPNNRRVLVDHRLRSATMEFHQRLALPAACLVFAILALPLGVTRIRSGKGAAFALSLLVILIYWTAYTMSWNQTNHGFLPPALGPWVANLVLLPWAVIGIWRLRYPPRDRRGLLVRVWCGLVGALSALARRLRPGTPTVRGENEPLGNGDENVPLADLGGTPSRFVRRIDQYVGRTYIRTFLFGIGSAYLVFTLVELKNLMDGLARSKQSFSLVLGYFKYFAPGALYMVLPISCLVAAVVTFTLLSRSGELTAIKASGISMRRVTIPVLLLTALLCGVSFVVQDRIAPQTNRKAQILRDQIMGRAPRSYGAQGNGRWAFGPEGRRLYHYRVYNPESENFQELTVFTIDKQEPRILDHRFAKNARWTGDRWELEGGWYRTFPEGDLSRAVYQAIDGTVELPLDPPQNFASRELSLTRVRDLPELLSVSELKQEIRSLRDSGYDITRLRVDYHGKWAQAAAPFIMALLGLPFAFRVGRRGSLYGIGVALLLVLVYWATFALFNALGLETILEPVYAAWAPNILFGLVGVYLMLYVRT